MPCEIMGMCMREIEDEDSLDQMSPRLIEGERCTEYYSIINDRIVSPYIYIYIYMYGQKRNSIIYASTCIVCSSVEYVYKNLFEMKRIKWKHKIKKNRVENTK
jgi:hypothetical protein